MCGPGNTYRPLGGALAVLNPLTTPPAGPQSPSLSADLAFHTPGNPARLRATHARITPTAESTLEGLLASSIHLVIHSSGDLRLNASDSGLFRHFALSPAAFNVHNDYVEFQLEKPLALEVGDDGIIGRRVSLCSSPVPGPDNTFAEGIVGFNFLAHSAL